MNANGHTVDKISSDNVSYSPSAIAEFCVVIAMTNDLTVHG